MTAPEWLTTNSGVAAELIRRGKSPQAIVVIDYQLVEGPAVHNDLLIGAAIYDGKGGIRYVYSYLSGLPSGAPEAWLMPHETAEHGRPVASRTGWPPLTTDDREPIVNAALISRHQPERYVRFNYIRAPQAWRGTGLAAVALQTAWVPIEAKAEDDLTLAQVVGARDLVLWHKKRSAVLSGLARGEAWDYLDNWRLIFQRQSVIDDKTTVTQILAITQFDQEGHAARALLSCITMDLTASQTTARFQHLYQVLQEAVAHTEPIWKDERLSGPKSGGMLFQVTRDHCVVTRELDKWDCIYARLLNETCFGVPPRTTMGGIRGKTQDANDFTLPPSPVYR